MSTHSTRRRPPQQGFSLIELLVVLFILTLVMGVVFGEINSLQQRYRTEETKLDLSQEAREVMDMMVRDLNTAGFPSVAMFSLGTLMEPATSDLRNAVGLVSITPDQIWFEGDLEGNGSVRSVRYTLVAGPGNTCPCELRRSEVPKANNTAPWSQAAGTPVTLINTIINSNRTIAGNSIMPDGTSLANNNLYAAYRPPPVFAAFNAAGAEIALPLNIQTTAGALAMRDIRTIRITLNVLAQTPDMQTNLRPVMALTSHARIRN